MKPQTIQTPGGEELVVLPRRDYDALLARAGDEEAEDRMTLLIAAEARSETPLPKEVSQAVLEGASLLRALRMWRGLTQVDLAAAADVTQSYLSELENRAKTASPDVARRLARALDIPPEWLG